MKMMKYFFAAGILAFSFITPASGAKKETKPAQVPSGAILEKDIAYIPGGSKAQVLDLYLPETAGKPAVPLLMFVHGGGWRGGSKDGCPAKFLAQHGYAVASIDYRLAREAVFPAQIEDCRAALRFLRSRAAKYNIDPGRFGVWGGSAGGHLAALLGTSAAVDFSKGPEGMKAPGKLDETARVQCVIDMYGPTELSQVAGRNPDRNDVWKAAAALLGPCADDKELMSRAKWASPVTYVNRDNPPFLIQHGDADVIVPLEQSRILLAALQKAGVEATLTVLPGAGHAGAPLFTEENHKTILEFLDKHLKAGK